MKIKAHTSIIGETGYNNHSRNFFTAINKLHEVKIRNFTVGKSWKGNGKTPHEGERYLSKEHKEMLYEQVLWVKDSERGNFPIYSFDESFVPDINITLEPMNHYLFYDNHKGYNIGYNVWETTEYPQAFFNLIHKYDQFWVPTKWQKDNLVKQGYQQDKIKIVPEGIDPEVFKPAAKKPADKFRFILFGKWEYRKSTQEILSCFLEVFEGNEDVELIASIDNDHKGEKGQAIKEKLKDLGLKSDKIKLLHFPPASEYLDYLQQGDVFISCARSEGWNLPLIEAMACGVPSIYSNWGAQLEFAEGKGLPVKIKGEIPAINDDGSILPGNYCEPDWEDFKRTLSYCYLNHKSLKEKALKDSEEIRKTFTWENAAKIASNHIETLFSKEKLLYICPHLSTGGQPQYALKQAETFGKNYEVHLVEYDTISVSYNVQKNKIKDLLRDRYYCLEKDKAGLLYIIGKIKPSVIHFQEVPEHFMSEEIASKIFNPDRAYKIVCTTHNTKTDPEHLVYIPDKFVLVSEWSKQQFVKRLGLKTDLQVWEYPVENLRTISKQAARKALGLDDGFKHVLNVGLFTPGKNQKEVIEAARGLINEKIKFHFVGNLAPNFEYYWRPLIDSLPKNCVIWNERSDTELFYQAADLFCFTSNFELNPLVIKEALSYDLKIVMRRLDTYLSSYDNNKMVSYINDLKEDIKNAIDLKKGFEWGPFNKETSEMINKEVFSQGIYEKFFEVSEGDVVVDIGASVGPFTCSILGRKPLHVYSIEPSEVEFPVLVRNTRGHAVTPINKAISNSLESSVRLNVFFDNGSPVELLAFKKFTELYSLDKIDFLKLDCEGGEYSVFVEENLDYLTNKVKSIVGEWHLRTSEQKEKFRLFRDQVLPKFKNYKVHSIDGVDIKWDLLNEHFIEYYEEVMIYIENE